MKKSGYKQFLADVKRVCSRDGIEYVTPKFNIREVFSGNIKIGVTYDYENEVLFALDVDTKYYRSLYWVKNNQLCIANQNKSVKVALDKIEMYTQDGSVQYVPIVRNAGQSVSLTGALVGGALAGAAGMVVGATKDRNKITTDVKAIDNTELYVYYRDDNNLIKMFKCEKPVFQSQFKFFEMLATTLPDKSDKYLLANQMINEQGNKSDNYENNLEGKLSKLKKLYEDDLISKADYEAKKKELLNDLN